MEQGVIKKVQDVKISEFEGEYSYLGTTLRQANIEPMPSLSDVRRVVTEFGILPLGTAPVYPVSAGSVICIWEAIDAGDSLQNGK